MRKMSAFGTDNTRGYSLIELALLNGEWRARGGHLLDDEDEQALLAEEILKAPKCGVVHGA